MTAHCSKPTSHSYYVVMIDYGKLGLEAVVYPERTRRHIVDMIRHGEFKNIAFIHEVIVSNMGFGQARDVTEEILDAAELQAAE